MLYTLVLFITVIPKATSESPIPLFCHVGNCTVSNRTVCLQPFLPFCYTGSVGKAALRRYLRQEYDDDDRQQRIDQMWKTGNKSDHVPKNFSILNSSTPYSTINASSCWSAPEIDLRITKAPLIIFLICFAIIMLLIIIIFTRYYAMKYRRRILKKHQNKLQNSLI